MEYVKIALMDRAGNIKVIDPMEVDGSYDKKVWAVIDSNTSQLVLSLLTKKQYKVFTMGDYFYKWSQHRGMVSDLKYHLEDRLYDKYLYSRDDYTPHGIGKAKKDSQTMTDKVYSSMMEDVKKVYEYLWEQKTHTNVKLPKKWEHRTTVRVFTDSCCQGIDQRELIYNSVLHEVAPVYRAIQHSQAKRVNPIFPMTACFEHNPIGYGYGYWIGLYLSIVPKQYWLDRRNKIGFNQGERMSYNYD